MNNIGVEGRGHPNRQGRELEKSPVGIDKYLEEWRRHSLETADREIAWLEDMIKTERK